MNCDLAHERLVSAAYGELPDDLVPELERHLSGCTDCQSEREQMRALKLLADAYPVLDPEPNLMARSRMRLEEALDAVPPLRWYQRLSQRMRNGAASLQAVPVAASVLLLIGGGAGTLGGYRLALNRAAHAATEQSAQTTPNSAAQVAPASTEIASVSSIVRRPNSGIVEVHYNQVVPQRIEGSMNDPAIRQLLMLASENAASANVRDDSVGLLAAECREGHRCRAEGIRDALMVALRYDKNVGVREKALRGLEPYVTEDVQVRDAVLEALMNDPDARIRNAAVNLLEPVEADTSVRQVLYSVSNSDQNPHIRTVSRQVLNQVPEIQ